MRGGRLARTSRRSRRSPPTAARSGLSESENADLFWAARGAGLGFFAVVTAFRLRLLAHPDAVASSTITFPLAETERVADWAVRTAHELPANVETGIVLAASGPAAAKSGPGPRLTLTSTSFAATHEEAVRALAPVDACPFLGRALSHELSAPTTFAALHEDAAGTWPSQHRYAVDTLWSTDAYATQLVRAAGQIAKAPSDDSLVLFPVEPVAPDPDGQRNMAFSELGASYLAAFAIWDDPAADEANTGWLRRTMDRLDPGGTGSHYIAEADLEAGASRSQRSYSPADWEKLKQIKARWDPDGLFHSHPTTTPCDGVSPGRAGPPAPPGGPNVTPPQPS